jgi:Zn-dependent protease
MFANLHSQSSGKMKAVVKCQYCDKDVALPFKCTFCNQYYCTEHRLPENHECPEYWRARAPREQPQPIVVEEGREATRYEYKYTYKPPSIPRHFRFSLIEIRHLTLSALLVMGVGLSVVLQIRMDLVITPEILVSLAVVFTFAFILHELAHKLVAQRYGLWAEYRLTLLGALLTLLSIISPIKLISPGAVMIAGPMRKGIAGKTGLAGPLTNIVLSVVFTALYPLKGPIQTIAMMGTAFNSWIALQNLIPFGVLDGAKVFVWNKAVWGVAFIISIAFTIFTFVYLF